MFKFGRRSLSSLSENTNLGYETFIRQFSLLKCLAGGAVLLGSVGGYAYVYRKDYNQNIVTNVFQNGQKVFVTDTSVLVNRRSAEDLLKQKLLPNIPTLSTYCLVYGENGTGKTTTVRKIAQETGHGVVFVEFVGLQPLGEAIADAFEVRSKYDPFLSLVDAIAAKLMLLPNLSDEQQLVDELMLLIENAAMEYKRKHNGVPPALIIDNVNYALKQPGGEAVLKTLQIWAKECADKNILLISFISSDGPTVDLLKKQSAASRMRLVELVDMTDSEAMGFLFKNVDDACRRKLQSDSGATKLLAEVVRDVIGGRAFLLADLANDMAGSSDHKAAIIDFVASYLSQVQDHFQSSDMVSKEQSMRYSVMWRMADMVLTSPTGRVSMLDIELSNEDYAFLKQSSVFSFHHGEVGFNTPAHRTMAQSLKQQEQKKN